MSEQNKERVRQYYEQVLKGRDLEAVGDFFADDERVVEGSPRWVLSVLRSVSRSAYLRSTSS